jgi:hypothetical protein
MQLLQITGNDVCQRESRLSFHFEKALLPKMMFYFYKVGMLLPQSIATPGFSDSEYLGAAIGFAGELARYAINRACEVGPIAC